MLCVAATVHRRRRGVLEMKKIKAVTHGCPYCGSLKGFELKRIIYDYWDEDGEPAGYDDDGVQAWKHPRCIECGKSVKIGQA